MIFRSDEGYLCDRTSDQMDSAVRASIITLFAYVGNQERIETYVKNGLMVRSPAQPKASNPRNCTRDQMIPLFAALHKINQQDLAKQVFINVLKRLCFAQNFERDWPGSLKFPWPHSVTENGVKYELLYFDFADPFTPDHLWFMSICSNHWLKYWLAPIGSIWLILSIFLHSKSSHHESNQLICLCSVAGSFYVKLFKRLCKDHEQKIIQYWDKRKEKEYSAFLIEYLRKVQ